jgi:DNA recombination protein RmuC
MPQDLLPFVFIGLVALLAIVVWLLFLVRDMKRSQEGAGKREGEESARAMQLLQSQLHELRNTLDSRLERSSDRMSASVEKQFSESQRLMQNINTQVNEQLMNVVRGVTEVSESSKQVFTVAESLKNLEKVLKHQKQRGNLGEASLELILSNILPPTAYKMQYEFPGGETVDAVIMTKDGTIPVDAKFSLDNYQRLSLETDEVRRADLEHEFKNDLKKRIDETAKYVRPKDGTLPFAFMYIPAEGIYYDLLVNEVGNVKVNTRSLIDYAYKDKNVIIVSPTTFAAYLQSVLYGFRAFQIEERAKDIQKNVEQLSRHINAYDTYFKKVGTALSTTVSHYNTAGQELGKIDKDILRITGEKAGIETSPVEKPLLAERE